MELNRNWKKLVLGGLVMLPGVALATTLSLSGTTVSARPELNGTVIADTTRSIVCNGTTIGQIQDSVLKETGGTLDFYRKVNVTASGWTVQGVKDQQVTWSYYGHPDADYRTDGLGDTGPSTLDYMSGGGSVQILEFQFGTNLSTSNSSKYFFAASTSTTYTTASNSLEVRARYNGVDYFCQIPSSYRSY